MVQRVEVLPAERQVFLLDETKNAWPAPGSVRPRADDGSCGALVLGESTHGPGTFALAIGALASAIKSSRCHGWIAAAVSAERHRHPPLQGRVVESSGRWHSSAAPIAGARAGVPRPIQTVRGDNRRHFCAALCKTLHTASDQSRRSSRAST
jgi:hypothetical protein